MYIFDGIYIIGSAVIFPTFDSYSDIGLIEEAFTKDQIGWASAMMFPILVNLLCTSYIWYHSNLDTDKEKKWTWILVFLLLWPQYQAVKIAKRIFQGRCYRGDDEDMKREREVGSLEAYTESIPQYFILTVMAISKGGLATCGNFNFSSSDIVGKNEHHINATCIYRMNETEMKNLEFYQIFGHTKSLFDTFHFPMYYFFRLSYYTTLASCTFGIVKFLDVGPTRILPENGWKNYIGYTLAVVSVFYSLYTKALGLGYDGFMLNIVLSFLGVCDLSGTNECTGTHYLFAVLIWFCINMVPQFIFATYNLLIVVGGKKYIASVLMYPQLILCPVFSYFSFGAINGMELCHTYGSREKQNQKVSISKNLTWINFLISHIPSLVLWIFVLSSSNVPEKIPSDFGKLSPTVHILVWDILPMLVVIIFTGIVIYMNKYKGVLDIENVEEVFIFSTMKGEVRNKQEQSMYVLDKKDSDRAFTSRRVSVVSNHAYYIN